MTEDDVATYDARRAPARQRVARGARWLDERLPDWHTKVDPVTLNITSSTTCVIAQAFDGSFRQGLFKLDPDYTIGLVEYGFNDRYVGGRSDRDALEAAWTLEIHRRRYGSDTPPLRQRVRRFVYDTLRALGYR